MIRSFIGAVICANTRTRASVKLSFPESYDKAVAQMSFVSQLTLAIGLEMITDLPRLTRKRQPRVACPLARIAKIF
jgi:hypothetical protein